MISVAQAECVVAVALHGSFRKAAAALFMAQPAVSATVYKVERVLRVEQSNQYIDVEQSPHQYTSSSRQSTSNPAHRPLAPAWHAFSPAEARHYAIVHCGHQPRQDPGR